MTVFGMTPKQRDIVLVPVPFSDLSSAKKRPVLVLSKTSYNRKASDVVAAAITSNLAASNIGIIITADDLAEGALPVDSLVRVDKIYTLNKRIIIKRYGRLNDAAFHKVLEALDDLLGRRKL